MSVTKLSLEEALEAQKREDRERLEKARAMALGAVLPEVEALGDLVPCRVLPMGDSKISMGQHIAGVGEATYARGDEFEAPAAIANELEKRGFVEVMKRRSKVAETA